MIAEVGGKVQALRHGLAALKWTHSRYNAGMEIFLITGIGVGLASVAGVRAFLPLALVARFSAVGLFGPPSPYVDVGGDGWWWSVFGVFAALSVGEGGVERVGGAEAGSKLVVVM